MKTIVTTLVAIALSATAANALTLKKGEVISDGQVVAANSTASAIANIENMGYHISGGQLHLDGVSIDLSDLVGKSKGEVVELIGSAAAEAVEANGGDLSEATSAAAAAASVADAAYTGAANGHTAAQVIESAKSGEGVCVTCS